jgi:hypothetical protein
MISKATIDYLAGELQDIKTLLNELELKRKLIEDKFKNEGEHIISGDDTTVIVEEITRKILDQDKLKEFVKKEALEQCRKISTYFIVKVFKKEN